MLTTGEVQTLYTVILICTNESKHGHITAQRDDKSNSLILAKNNFFFFQNNFYTEHVHGGNQIDWLKHRFDVKQPWVSETTLQMVTMCGLRLIIHIL